MTPPTRLMIEESLLGMLTFVLAFVLTSFGLVAFVLTTLGFFAAAFLTFFCLAAVLGAVVHTTLAIFLLAGGVGAHAVLRTLVLAGLFTDSSRNGIFGSSLVGLVVAASGHAKSESSSDGNG